MSRTIGKDKFGNSSYRPGLLLIVRFAYDRRFVGLVFVVLVLVINIVIIVVGVSRRHRIDHDDDGAPVDQPSGRVLGNARSHVGSCRMSWTITPGDSRIVRTAMSL